MAALERPAAGRRADGVRKGCDLFEAAGHALDAVPVEGQPVQHRAGEPSAPRLLQVLGILLKDVAAALPEQCGHVREGAVLLLRPGPGELSRSLLR